jgi:hypothetical protein
MAEFKNLKKRVLPAFIVEHKANQRPFEVRRVREKVEIFRNNVLIGYGYIFGIKDNGKILDVLLKESVIVDPDDARMTADHTRLVWVPFWQRYKVLELPQRSYLGHGEGLKQDQYFMPLNSVTVKFYPSTSKVPKQQHLPEFRKLFRDKFKRGSFYD